MSSRQKLSNLHLLVAEADLLDGIDILLHLVNVNVRNRIVAVEDARNFLEGWALGLDVEEVHKDQLAKVPQGVEQHQVPVVGQVLPGQLVGLVAEREEGLQRDVHDHHALGTEAERENFERVRDEKTREANVVADTKAPDEDELSVTGPRVCLARVLVHGTGDGPANERGNHA